MSTRTFLQIVNDVLLELREPSVATWDETDYSELIGRFVNTAKRNVEACWTWNALRSTFTVSTSAGDVQYTLTGAKERFQFLGPQYNKTQEAELDMLNRQWHRAQFFNDFTDTTGIQTGNITGISRHESLDNGDVQINVWPVPTGSETLKLFGYNPPNDFTAGADICYIPYTPIVNLAVAIARAERGEDGGLSSAEQLALAKQLAGDDIALDAAKHGEDTSWDPV